MSRFSLRLRTITAALLALLLFIPLMGFGIRQAFVASLTSSAQERMEIQAMTLISEFDIVDGQHTMPEVMIHGAFNLPESGLYGIIMNLDRMLWRSMSAVNWKLPEIRSFPLPGNQEFVIIATQEKDYFRFTYTAEFETDIGFTPVAFHVFQDKKGFDNEVNEFSITLLYWLAIISAVLFLLLIFTLNTALRPINSLVREINGIESGDNLRIEDEYPRELETLKNNLNHLLSTEKNQRERYKNSLGDLAHSLKTPLAVLSGSNNLLGEEKRMLEQVDSIIQRQLKRAVAGTGSGWNLAVKIHPIAEQIAQAMEKVYHDKQLAIEFEIDESTSFPGDKTDLMEILGNLMDNACKAASCQVLLSATKSQNQLFIQVEDDGKGIPVDKRTILLERGKRLDSYESGQGIGMALVSDLVSAYQGNLHITESKLGGAKIELIFPLPAPSE